MSRLSEVGERDGWRCWICDGTVDPDRSVNDDRGPSVDERITDRRARSKGKRKGDGGVAERLAHRACNTGKGKVDAVVPWSDDLFVVDPAPIIPSVDRLVAKGGREVMARCPTRDDAEEAAHWLVDRVGRLQPDLTVTAQIDEGGGQFLVALRT